MRRRQGCLWFTQREEKTRREERRKEEKRGDDGRGEEKWREEKKREEKRRKAHQQLWNSCCEKSSLFPNVTCPAEPRIHRTKHNTCGKPQRIQIRDGWDSRHLAVLYYHTNMNKAGKRLSWLRHLQHSGTWARRAHHVLCEWQHSVLACDSVMLRRWTGVSRRVQVSACHPQTKIKKQRSFETSGSTKTVHENLPTVSLMCAACHST